jgi:hypothetical protein
MVSLLVSFITVVPILWREKARVERKYFPAEHGSRSTLGWEKSHFIFSVETRFIGIKMAVPPNKYILSKDPSKI